MKWAHFVNAGIDSDSAFQIWADDEINGRFKSQQLLTGPPILEAPTKKLGPLPKKKKRKKRKRKGRASTKGFSGITGEVGRWRFWVFFFFFFSLSETNEICFGCTKMEISTGKKAFHEGKNATKGRSSSTADKALFRKCGTGWNNDLLWPTIEVGTGDFEQLCHEI